ncbi:J domain-containing protein [Streptomyces sp. L06]|nr:J domain-containing protein [Streptomyces sp. L06]
MTSPEAESLPADPAPEEPSQGVPSAAKPAAEAPADAASSATPADAAPVDAAPVNAAPADAASATTPDPDTAPTSERTPPPRPEERLEKAVRVAEQALIEFEIAVETFRVEVENFSRLHHQKLGPMYTRLDELDAQIAEAKAARTGDAEDLRLAREARARVMPMPGVEELFHGWIDSEGLSTEGAAMLNDQPVRPPQRVRPSADARRLYRDLVRKAHPDLAQGEAERTRRDAFIARVNHAYTLGDEEALRALTVEWEAGPASEEQPPSRSEELYARLEWLAERKEMLTLVAKRLEDGAIGSMLRVAQDDPDGLLDQIAEQLLAEVAGRERELAALLE